MYYILHPNRDALQPKAYAHIPKSGALHPSCKTQNLTADPLHPQTPALQHNNDMLHTSTHELHPKPGTLQPKSKHPIIIQTYSFSEMPTTADTNAQQLKELTTGNNTLLKKSHSLSMVSQLHPKICRIVAWCTLMVWWHQSIIDSDRISTRSR